MKTILLSFITVLIILPTVSLAQKAVPPILEFENARDHKKYQRDRQFWFNKAPDGNRVLYMENLLNQSNLNNNQRSIHQVGQGINQPWQNVGPFDVPNGNILDHYNGLGRVHAIALSETDPLNTWYIGTHAAVYKTTDKGENWQSMTDVMGLPIVGGMDLIAKTNAVSGEDVFMTATIEAYLKDNGLPSYTGVGMAGAYTFGVLEYNSASNSWSQKKRNDWQ